MIFVCLDVDISFSSTVCVCILFVVAHKCAIDDLLKMTHKKIIIFTTLDEYYAKCLFDFFPLSFCFFFYFCGENLRPCLMSEWCESTRRFPSKYRSYLYSPHIIIFKWPSRKFYESFINLYGIKIQQKIVSYESFFSFVSLRSLSRVANIFIFPEKKFNSPLQLTIKLLIKAITKIM